MPNSKSSMAVNAVLLPASFGPSTMWMISCSVRQVERCFCEPTKPYEIELS